MFPLQSNVLKMISVVHVFTFITPTLFLNGVNGRSIITLKPQQGVDASVLNSKVAPRKTITVDVNGSEKFKSIQDAIDSIPSGNQEWVVIQVKKGIYREKVTIPREKGHIMLLGSGRTKTAIVWSQSSENNYESSTFKVEASHFIAFGISFKNDAPTGIANTSHNQSVAAYVGGDKVAFYSCGFYSSHNTLLDNKGRHYYDRCYFQGAIDVIFGRARSIFHECEIFVIADKRVEIGGSVTAHIRTSINENTGFVFTNGRVYGIGHSYLGRPNGDHSRVVFANTYMSKAVRTEGWSDWNHHGSFENLYHAEYNCYGPGSSTNGRARWLKKLSDQEAAPFLSTDFIDGKKWLIAGQSST
ncbi:probable pectinesterase 67 [Rutidosis leptorrhynchoides]|uniref:probable pectinesterase 67 n=1 Tax=Rutidosis leptorrhynchoides TaxID=125765 RepID=UPI003A992F19